MACLEEPVVDITHIVLHNGLGRKSLGEWVLAVIIRLIEGYWLRVRTV